MLMLVSTGASMTRNSCRTLTRSGHFNIVGVGVQWFVSCLDDAVFKMRRVETPEVWQLWPPVCWRSPCESHSQFRAAGLELNGIAKPDFVLAHLIHTALPGTPFEGIFRPLNSGRPGRSPVRRQLDTWPSRWDERLVSDRLSIRGHVDPAQLDVAEDRGVC